MLLFFYLLLASAPNVVSSCRCHFLPHTSNYRSISQGMCPAVANTICSLLHFLDPLSSLPEKSTEPICSHAVEFCEFHRSRFHLQGTGLFTDANFRTQSIRCWTSSVPSKNYFWSSRQHCSKWRSPDPFWYLFENPNCSRPFTNTAGNITDTLFLLNITKQLLREGSH